MLVKDTLNSGNPAFSFEFFPPKTTDGWDNLFDVISDLVPLNPASVSVTYGAGGSTRDATHDLVTRISKETELTVVAHLTCVGSTQNEIYQILKRYDDAKIYNILALRGDPPKGQSEWHATEGGFSYASDLVAFIKEKFPHFGVGVAGFPEGHPATPNRLKEIEHLKAKVDAGADYICTQLFFDNRDFYDFKDRCHVEGIHIPILAGLMPITSAKGMVRMAELAGGARIPGPLLKTIRKCPDDQAVEKAGIHWATEQVRDLITNDVDGIHFYTLNKAGATQKIYETLTLNSVHVS
ncbi:MAG: methylenetetrahydrofolate reductase [NAD(P)H] [Verrucomicrobiota bacterium]